MRAMKGSEVKSGAQSKIKQVTVRVQADVLDRPPWIQFKYERRRGEHGASGKIFMMLHVNLFHSPNSSVLLFPLAALQV